MMNFYVTMVFLGIVLVTVSLIMVIFDRKKVFSFTKSFDEKKQELVEIISDAEQMIEELNRFSDYIVTQMDLKNEELRVNLKNADEDLKALGQKAQEIRLDIAASTSGQVQRNEYKPAAAVNGNLPEAVSMPVDATYMPNADIYQPFRQAAKKTEKVIPMKNRYSEVLHLAETGLSELDIARSLGMGKGEVELILGLNKN